ncbi:hypothetical protein QYS48_05745 [Marivirga arenosa]|uniref:THUMP-like domain-containing protein n=1 Tax=Marivirga arenosa TaxID=3059076 RepID=A0AA49GEJ1_9BACT|nr:hypothetical protein [Marivirga sp. ABR2-2]WKK86452.2 hypothetical protein QYS48_05745 [Marivirga sp. ABR2-2]
MELSANRKDVWKFIKDHEQDDPAQLVFKQKQFPDLPLKEIASQIQARQKAKSKLPEWADKEIWFPPLLSLEQSSSEATAKFKSSLLSGNRFADLTGGFGIDCYYIAQNFKESHYIEQQKVLCDLANYNFDVLKSDIQIHQTQASEFLVNNSLYFDWIYLDPARRGDKNQKVFLWEDCSPNLTELLPLLFEKSKKVMVKAAPMQDISRGISELDQRVKDIYIIEHNGEVKELLYILNKEKVSAPNIHAIQLNKMGDSLFHFQGKKHLEDDLNYQFENPENYLYEPAPSIMKSGLFKQLAKQFNISKLHPNSQLFTNNDLIENFTGRKFKIINQVSAQKKALKKVLPEMKANLSCRNFPMPVAQLRKKLGLKDGGEYYLFATTLKNDEKVILVCKKLK